MRDIFEEQYDEILTWRSHAIAFALGHFVIDTLDEAPELYELHFLDESDPNVIQGGPFHVENVANGNVNPLDMARVIHCLYRHVHPALSYIVRKEWRATELFELHIPIGKVQEEESSEGEEGNDELPDMEARAKAHADRVVQEQNFFNERFGQFRVEARLQYRFSDFSRPYGEFVLVVAVENTSRALARERNAMRRMGIPDMVVRSVVTPYTLGGRHRYRYPIPDPPLAIGRENTDEGRWDAHVRVAEPYYAWEPPLPVDEGSDAF